METQKYTLNNFIVFPKNELAYAVAQAIIKEPLKYNPALFYGEWKSGKTHLLHAIENAIKENNKKSKILYVNGERFLSDIIDSIRAKKFKNLKKHYRNYDVVMIDDIDVPKIRSMESTQETLIEIIHELTSNNKQVIITSELDPADSIPFIWKHIVSNYLGGIIVDIFAPDLVSNEVK